MYDVCMYAHVSMMMAKWQVSQFRLTGHQLTPNERIISSLYLKMDTFYLEQFS